LPARHSPRFLGPLKRRPRSSLCAPADAGGNVGQTVRASFTIKR
jgi:hypothetical protein